MLNRDVPGPACAIARGPFRPQYTSQTLLRRRRPNSWSCSSLANLMLSSSSSSAALGCFFSIMLASVLTFLLGVADLLSLFLFLGLPEVLSKCSGGGIGAGVLQTLERRRASSCWPCPARTENGSAVCETCEIRRLERGGGGWYSGMLLRLDLDVRGDISISADGEAALGPELVVSPL